MKLIRYRVANALFAVGLWALPPGRVRSELAQLLDVWRTRVEAAVRSHREGTSA